MSADDSTTRSAAYVIERTDEGVPRLHGPFRTEEDAAAFVTFLFEGARTHDVLAWIVQAEPVDDDDDTQKTEETP